jgi:hypothetical protein
MFIHPDPNFALPGTGIIYFQNDPETLPLPGTPISPTPVPAPPPTPALPYAQLSQWFFDNQRRLVGIRGSNNLGDSGLFAREPLYDMLSEDHPMANTGETAVEVSTLSYKPMPILRGIFL